MKKSLVLGLFLVFVLGMGTALANPFTDLPANHWAYASVAKLAKAGIVDGYGDGKFIGNSNMTRYEMAQIVAKAMANSDKADMATKAQIEKLSAEFATELQKLGLKVASLEKKTDNVKITGEVRFAVHAWGKEKLGNDVDNAYETYSMRSRLWLTGQVNDSWQYTGMLENTQDLRTNNQETTTKFKRAYVQGKVGAVAVTAGRFNYLSQYGMVLDTEADGLVLGLSKGKLALDIFALRPNADYINYFYNDVNEQKNTQIYGAKLDYSFTDKLHAAATYYDIQGVGDNTGMVWWVSYGKINTSILELGLDYKFDQNWFAWANYIRGGKGQAGRLAADAANGILSGSRDGWAAGLNYGATDRDKPGSYQLRFTYYDIPYAGSINTQTIEYPFNQAARGFQGYSLGGSYMLAKNIDLNVDYYDFKSRVTYNGDKVKQNLLFCYVRFYF